MTDVIIMLISMMFDVVKTMSNATKRVVSVTESNMYDLRDNEVEVNDYTYLWYIDGNHLYITDYPDLFDMSDNYTFIPSYHEVKGRALFNFLSHIVSKKIHIDELNDKRNIYLNSIKPLDDDKNEE